jgi:phosphoglucomutase
MAPGYAKGLSGIARSMPTSRAADRVAAALDIPCYETPTGWKYFGNLLDAGRVTICGEESFGAGSDHVREKDGLWAVLFWLNILAARAVGVEGLSRAHWRRFGRHFYLRHDYEDLKTEPAEALMAALRQAAPHRIGRSFAGMTVTESDDFAYHDPVDHSLSEHQGVRLVFGDEARIVYRLSGTGTAGATLRIYLERFEPDVSRHNLAAETVLEDLASIARDLSEVEARTGRHRASVVT